MTSLTNSSLSTTLATTPTTLLSSLTSSTTTYPTIFIPFNCTSPNTTTTNTTGTYCLPPYTYNTSWGWDWFWLVLIVPVGLFVLYCLGILVAAMCMILWALGVKMGEWAWGKVRGVGKGVKGWGVRGREKWRERGARKREEVVKERERRLEMAGVVGVEGL